MKICNKCSFSGVGFSFSALIVSVIIYNTERITRKSTESASETAKLTAAEFLKMTVVNENTVINYRIN